MSLKESFTENESFNKRIWIFSLKLSTRLKKFKFSEKISFVRLMNSHKVSYSSFFILDVALVYVASRLQNYYAHESGTLGDSAAGTVADSWLVPSWKGCAGRTSMKGGRMQNPAGPATRQPGGSFESLHSALCLDPASCRVVWKESKSASQPSQWTFLHHSTALMLPSS